MDRAKDHDQAVENFLDLLARLIAKQHYENHCRSSSRKNEGQQQAVEQKGQGK